MALQMTLVGTAPRIASEACLETGRYVSGSELTTLLIEATGENRWFLGRQPLALIGRLPKDGHVLLSTTGLPHPHPTSPTRIPDTRILHLVVAQGPDPGGRLPLLRGEHTIGRIGADLCVADPALSRIHALIRVDALGVRVLDQGSGNGISVAGHTITEGFLVEGGSFTAGGSTFLLVGAGSSPDAPDRIWPQEPLEVAVAPPSGRILPQALGAILPMLIGIGLFVATGSWYFLAFCAIGLATGGVSAVIGFREKRRHRRAVAAAVTAEEERLRALALPIGEAAQEFRTAPSHYTGPADRVLSVGRGAAPAHLTAGSLARGTTPPMARDVPCFLPWGPGTVGVIEGPEAASHALVRSLLLRLAPELFSGAGSLLVSGNASFIPVEFRRMPGVQLLDRVPSSIPGPLPTLVLAFGPDPEQCFRVDDLARQARSAGARGPGFILVSPRSISSTSDWSVDTGSGQVVHGPLSMVIRPDRLSTEVLGALLRFILPGPEFGPITSEDPGVPAVGANSTNSLVCSLGSDGEHRTELDLVTDGPHLLIAGTTGSGKSELLRSLVLGWCREYAATDLALMLIDFKGGSALGPLGVLPHVQALSTDLDGEGAARALESLGAELRRRENLLATAGASDYCGYRALAAASDEPLPRLVVVVDEFRVLDNELPDATERLVKVAMIGRSLGVHLVLATQRPQGAVSGELRANINSVLCLRLQSDYESSELLGTSDAARLDPAAPGSALLRRGSGNIEKFRVSSRTGPQPAPRLLVYGSRLGPARVATLPGPRRERTLEELIRLVGGRFAPDDLPINPFPRPLPPSLPQLPRRFLKTDVVTGIGLGLVDMVSEQRTAGWLWSPTGMGRLAIVGHPASGISPLLENLVAGLPRIGVRAFVIDGASLLAGWAKSRQVAGYVGISEPERIIDVMGLLEEAGAEEPLVLVVTGMADWAAVMDAQSHSDFDMFLATQARRCHGQGAALVLVGDRDLLISKAYPLCENRLFLPLGSGPETTIGWPRLRPVAPRPGRGIWVGPQTPTTGHAVQLVTAAPYSPARSLSSPDGQRQQPFALPLPDRISVSDLPQHLRKSPSIPGWYLVGVRGPDNRPWVWTPGSVGVILGRSGSGKSSLLRLLSAQTGLDGRLFCMSDAQDRQYTGTEDLEGLESADLLLIDDAELRPDRTTRLLDHAAAQRIPVVLAAQPSATVGYALPLGSVLRSGESVLALGPLGRATADQLGFRVPDLPGHVPGRGAALIDGQVRRFQCLLAPEAPD